MKRLQLRTWLVESQYMVSEFFEPVQSPNNLSMMDMLSGAVPRMDWEAQDLKSAWKTFKQHADFTFSGPLKEKSVPGQYLYLMLWVGEKGRTTFSTWKLSEEEQKKLINYVEKFEGYVKPRSNVIFSRY